MRNPTGMGAGTGHHYRNVAAQMQAYLKKPQKRTAYAGGRHQSYQIQEQAAIAQQYLHYGAQRMGVPPSIADEINGLAMDMMRNIFI